MDRLDFALPDFTRLSWVNDRAREVWEPRIGRITKAWLEIEWLSVAAGIRPCCLTFASPEGFLAEAPKWAMHGLGALPVEIQGISNNSYSNTGVKTQLGDPFAFRFVIGSPRNVSDFKCAWDASDQEAIGKLLGYPPCCHTFFRHVWVDQGLVDTTWPMAVAGANLSEECTRIEIQGPPEANILWRWMGVRAISHLPCRSDCVESVDLGKKMIRIGKEAGFGIEMDWLLDILSWPVEWSALHGIAEVKTPVLKVSACTDATARKYVVKRDGDRYPIEGGRGLSFPFRAMNDVHSVPPSGFLRGMDNPIQILEARPEWYASDNGFPSRIAMENAYKPIVDLAAAVLSGKRGGVLHLGCGNGVLLERIRDANPDIVPVGVDCDADRIEHARQLHPQFSASFFHDDIFESLAPWTAERRYALGIIMPGRLLGASPAQARSLKERMRERCDQILVYAHGDWLTRTKGLRGLAHKGGFLLLSGDQDVSQGHRILSSTCE